MAPSPATVPDAFVLGAGHTGAAALHRALLAHPDVVGPRAPGSTGTGWFTHHADRSARWYRRRFPAGASGRTSIEASSSYLVHPLAPERIAAQRPDARFVVVLRDPVERVLRHHGDNLRAGLEPLDLADAVAAEPARLEGEVRRHYRDPRYRSTALDHWSYVRRSDYAAHLRVWFSLLDREQFLVVRAEDLEADPGRRLAEVTAFLGLRPAALPFRADPPAPRPASQAAARAALGTQLAPTITDLAALLGTDPWWRGAVEPTRSIPRRVAALAG